MKNVLLLITADRFANPLIEYLKTQGNVYGWKITVGSLFDQALFQDLQRDQPDVSVVHIKDDRQCGKEIRRADLVMALTPDVMLLNIADACIAHSRVLISPNRLTRQLFAKRTQAEENDALILVECGFTPGLDHITAKKMIDHIHAKGGKISSFRTCSGSLVADSSVDNPWGFKLTFPAHELFTIGKGNNRYLMRGQLLHVPQHQIYARAESIEVQGLTDVMLIPEDDSLYCRKIYGLVEADTVMKGRLIRKSFQSVWDLIIRLGLTNGTTRIDMLEDRSFRSFVRSLLPWSPNESVEDLLRRHFNAKDEDIEKLRWLGLFEDNWFEGTQEITPALLLQYLMEHKMSLAYDDRDCVVIHHELDYNHNNYHYSFKATMVSEGDDERHAALAKAIGLTMGAAAKAVMVGNIKITGMHTPVRKEIYDPVLNELEDLGIAFRVDETRRHETESANSVTENAFPSQ